MKQSRANHILFEQLSGGNLWLARLFRRLGWQVKFLRLSPELAARFDRLERSGIVGLSYETIDRALPKLFARLAGLSRAFAADELATSGFYRGLCRAHGLNESQRRKLLVSLERQVSDDYYSFAELALFATELAGQPGAKRIYLWATADAVTAFASRADRNRYRNLKPPTLQAVLALVGTLFAAFRKVASKLARRSASRPSSGGVASAASAPHIPSAVNARSPRDCEVLFFPHKGIYYSEMFVKDQYYSADTTSPLHPSSILHLSLGETTAELEDSVKYYRERGIPHADLNDFKNSGKLTVAFETLSFLFTCAPALFSAVVRGQGAVVRLFAKLARQLSSVLHCLRPLARARLALVGYDVLFPPVLSLALSIRGIATAASQERFLSAWYDQNLPALDHYFVIGQVVADELKHKQFATAIDRIVPIGPVRLDLIHAEMSSPRPGKYATIKASSKLILALDFHSARTPQDNRLAIANSWATNQKFYRDLISLARALPSAHIVIKGKNADFLTVPEFAGIIQEMKQVPNLSVEQDYAKYTPERMVALADGVIALHTSLADEAMAAGKPVIIYDYFGFPSGFFDYEKLPAIASNMSELKLYAERVVRGEPLIDATRALTLRTRFYNDSFDGAVRKRLTAELERLYSNLRKDRDSSTSF